MRTFLRAPLKICFVKRDSSFFLIQAKLKAHSRGSVTEIWRRIRENEHRESDRMINVFKFRNDSRKGFLEVPLTAVLLSATGAIQAQVEIDQSIELTGSEGNRAIRNLEAPVSGTDAVNKDYVDNVVSGSGGSSLPVMISAESSSAMTLGAAMRYCTTLSEGDNTDWRLPTWDELSYALSQGGITVDNDESTNYIWFRTLAGNGQTSILNAHPPSGW